MAKNNKLISWAVMQEDDALTMRINSKKNPLVGLCKILLGPIIFLGCLALLALTWVQKHFTGVTLDMMVMQLRMPLKGTGGNYFLSFFLQVFLPSLVVTVVLLLLGHAIRKKGKVLSIGKWVAFPNRAISMILAIIFISISFGRAATELKLSQYLININTKSDFIEKNYVTPSSENIVFPEQKRNLVYIYLESMESTFLSKEQGGQMEQNIIPELYEIARDNVSFSDTDSIGGSIPLAGMGITSAAMVAQTSGLPLYLPDNWDEEKTREIFIDNATTLGDILADNGYAQYLVIGSDAKFGARDQYYKAHGDTVILDFLAAPEKGIIPADYNNRFWGMEDKYVYEFAKQELTQIAKEDRPFSLTLLTSDTHFPDGYYCDLCKDELGDSFSDVLSCASHQVSDFLQWLQQQDFYENTTVVIAGDHLSMDADYIKRQNVDVMHRRVYNAFINTAGVTPSQTQDRLFASTDLFPTTLAAMGVEIKGDRLGLGTNLYSDKPTLLEMYGYDVVNDEFTKKSDYYKEAFHTIKGAK